MDKHLGVAVGREGVALSAQLVHELAVVVDLAILDHLDPSVLVADWLVAAGEVDDREAPHRKATRTVDHRAVRVGAPVDQGVIHRGERRGIRGGGPVEADETAYPAHARESRERPGSGESAALLLLSLADELERGGDGRAPRPRC